MNDDDEDRRETPEHHDAWELFEARHHPAEIFYGILSFVFAAFLLTQIGSQTTFFDSMPLTRQPALWPVVAIVGMLVFGTLEVFFYWRRNDSFDQSILWPEVMLWLRAVEYFGWFMAYVLAVPIFGYLPSTIVFCLLLVWRLGYRRSRIYVAAVAIGIATVILFKSFLQVKIPGGQVYEYLPAGLRNFMILYL